MAELATIARPYAEALFKSARADLYAAAAWLDPIADIAENAQLQQFASNPKVSDAQVFDVISGVANINLPDNARNFLRTVIENGRLSAPVWHGLRHHRPGPDPRHPGFDDRAAARHEGFAPVHGRRRARGDVLADADLGLCPRAGAANRTDRLYQPALGKPLGLFVFPGNTAPSGVDRGAVHHRCLPALGLGRTPFPPRNCN